MYKANNKLTKYPRKNFGCHVMREEEANTYNASTLVTYYVYNSLF